jgi:hypothetical protein
MPCAGFRANLLSSKTNHLPSGSNDLLLDRHEFSLGHARPWPHSFPPEMFPSD